MDPAIVGAARIEGKHARVLSFSDPQAGRRLGFVCGSAKRGSWSRHRCGLKALQVRGVAGVAKEDRYCIDVVTQINATRAALDKVALCLLDGHVRHCLVGGPRGPSDPNEQAEELMGAVGRDDLARRRRDLLKGNWAHDTE